VTFSIPNYKNFIEGDAFWVVGGGPAAYITHTKSFIRRCIPEISQM
jgi:hypothetical protein